MKRRCAARASGWNQRTKHPRALKSRTPVSASSLSVRAGSSAGEHRSLDPKARDLKSPTHLPEAVKIPAKKALVLTERTFQDQRAGKRSVKRTTIRVFSF